MVLQRAFFPFIKLRTHGAKIRLLVGTEKKARINKPSGAQAYAAFGRLLSVYVRAGKLDDAIDQVNVLDGFVFISGSSGVPMMR